MKTWVKSRDRCCNQTAQQQGKCYILKSDSVLRRWGLSVAGMGHIWNKQSQWAGSGLEHMSQSPATILALQPSLQHSCSCQKPSSWAKSCPWFMTLQNKDSEEADSCVSCAAVILLKSWAIFLYKIEKNSSIQCSAIIGLTVLVNTSIYYRLLWQLVSRLWGEGGKN